MRSEYTKKSIFFKNFDFRQKIKFSLFLWQDSRITSILRIPNVRIMKQPLKNPQKFEELRKIWLSETQIMLILHRIYNGNFTQKMSENHLSQKNFQTILKTISDRSGLGMGQINMFLTSESTFKRFRRRRYILNCI